MQRRSTVIWIHTFARKYLSPPNRTRLHSDSQTRPTRCRLTGAASRVTTSPTPSHISLDPYHSNRRCTNSTSPTCSTRALAAATRPTTSASLASTRAASSQMQPWAVVSVVQAWELLLPWEEQAAALDWTATKRVCGLPMAPNCRRMPFADKTAQKAPKASGYATSGGRTCIKRWTCCARSSTNILTSAWLVYLFLPVDGRCFSGWRVSDLCLKCPRNGGKTLYDSFAVVSFLLLPLLHRHYAHTQYRTPSFPALSHGQSEISTQKHHITTRQCDATSIS